MSHGFSSHHIHSEYVRLNEMDYLHERGEERGLEEEDFEEDDREYPNSYRTENKVTVQNNLGQFNCQNDKE